MFSNESIFFILGEDDKANRRLLSVFSVDSCYYEETYIELGKTRFERCSRRVYFVFPDGLDSIKIRKKRVNV